MLRELVKNIEYFVAEGLALPLHPLHPVNTSLGIARHSRGALVALLACAALHGCTGQIEEGALGPRGSRPTPTPEPLLCTDVEPGRAPLRLLTVAEIDASLAALLGDTSGVATRLVTAPHVGGYSNNADTRVIGELQAEQLMAMAEDVAARATADLPALLRCDPAAEGERVCAERFVDRIAPAAFRRPLEASERTEILALYDAARADFGFVGAIESVLEVLLQSPHFLYRVEAPPVGARAGEVVRLDGHAIAVRLAFLFTGAPPSPELVLAAQSGELDTDEGVERHARIMLADARATETFVRFVDEWMDLRELEHVSRDPMRHAGWTDELPAAFRAETHAFARHVWEREGARWPLFLNARYRMMNATLAAFHGVEGGPSGDAFEPVMMDPAHHAGVLTQPSMLASRAKAEETSPIHRGMFVRAALLCGSVPPPPPGIDPIAPDPDGALTLRERLAIHRSEPVCGNCHRLLDPLGFGLEHFDETGRFRTTEAGRAVDASGDIADADVEGEFVGAVELGDRLAASRDVDRCIERQLFRFAQGRGESMTDDRCSLASIDAAFVGADRDLRELLVGIVRSDAFLHRRVLEGEER